MILISHRGNLNGTSPFENHPEYIQKALLKGFDVEIDVWFFGDGGYWLGFTIKTYIVFGTKRMTLH